MNRIEVFLQRYGPDLLCISEHWLREDAIEVCAIENYRLVASFCRSQYKNRGTVIFCRNGHVTNIVKFNVREENIEKVFESCRNMIKLDKIKEYKEFEPTSILINKNGKTSVSEIDYIVHNLNSLNITTKAVETEFSDHMALCMQFEIYYKEREPTKTYSTRNYSETKIQELCERKEYTNWNIIHGNNIEETFRLFTSTYARVMEEKLDNK
ncbi:hypothetical protein WA026_014105 [Henosepilachna vigintioctopunctata]|uniref:Uncharacterized protein n=1 Tax=Henosepilachna vigintioctopunctata TaxID=420089 RepID=A0AAW1TTL4_9CUCU